MTTSSPAGRVLLVGLTLSLVSACAPDEPAPEWVDDQLGGETTRRALRGRPFNQVIRNASNAELARFADGAEVFDRHLIAGDGLGPDFDDDGCLSCHIDQAADGEAIHLPQGFVNRIDHQLAAAGGLGPQAQMRRTDGDPEATLDLVWEIVVGHYDDGTRYELLRPRHQLGTGGRYPSHGPSSQRMAPPLIGLGLLEAVPETALEAASDPDDADDDGVSGRVRTVPDPLDPSRTVTGRFGWKASQPTIESQTLAALDQDMGIDMTGATTPADLDTPRATEEIDRAALADMIFYNRTIAVPIGRGRGADDVARGAQTFEEIGCVSCHTPTQRSGDDVVRGLTDQTFHPFTDLLLHDMGPDLDDGLAEPGAESSEWRTAPLWGLGRRVEVTGRRAFLHDGRARTPTEAVLWHGGEAKASRDAFRALDSGERRNVEAFLASL